MKGYVELGKVMVAPKVLRDANISITEWTRITGLTEDQLRRWARGTGLPYGVKW